MDHTSIDVYLVIYTSLLLLFGIGPKIALVPFLEVTAAIDGATKLVIRKMLITAGVVAVILVGLGERVWTHPFCTRTVCDLIRFGGCARARLS